MIKKLKEIYSKSKFSFIMMVITFCLGIFCLISSFIFINKEIIKSYFLLMTLVSFLPFFIFLLITIFSNKFYNKKNTTKISFIITGIMDFLLSFYYIFIILLFVLIVILQPKNNIDDYSNIINNDYLLSAFPTEISSTAKKIKFEYSPSFLQGAAEYTLYYVDETVNVQEFDNKYKGKSEWIGYKNDYFEKRGLLDGSIFYTTPVKEENENEFKLYLISSKCDNSGYCNHGEFLIASINENTKEIIYRARMW